MPKLVRPKSIRCFASPNIMFWTWSLTIISPAKISRRMISKLWGSNKLMWKTPQVWLWHICDPLDLLRCNPCALKTHLNLHCTHCEMLLKYLSGTSGALSAWFRTSLGFPTKSPVGVVVFFSKSKKEIREKDLMPGVEVEVASPVGSLHSQVQSYEGGQLPEVSPRLAWESKLLVTSAPTVKSLENWKP